MVFSTEPHQIKVEKPWGWEVIYTPNDSRWTGKILFIAAGKRYSFQYHDEKEETSCLFQGEAILWIENEGGEIKKIPMELMKGYTVRINQKHRIEAVSDTHIIEVSDPEKGNTFRLEDDYARQTETEADRDKQRGI